MLKLQNGIAALFSYRLWVVMALDSLIVKYLDQNYYELIHICNQRCNFSDILIFLLRTGRILQAPFRKLVEIYYARNAI
jgi:hypothetical protein